VFAVVSVDDPNCKQALLNRVEQADLLSRQMTKVNNDEYQ
jgi:hypothetical protein